MTRTVIVLGNWKPFFVFPAGSDAVRLVGHLAPFARSAYSWKNSVSARTAFSHSSSRALVRAVDVGEAVRRPEDEHRRVRAASLSALTSGIAPPVAIIDGSAPHAVAHAPRPSRPRRARVESPRSRRPCRRR